MLLVAGKSRLRWDRSLLLALGRGFFGVQEIGFILVVNAFLTPIR
jgi:hypothetical protein